MGYILKSISYVFDNADFPEEIREEIFGSSDEWELAATIFFKDMLFIHEIEFQAKTNKKNLILIFYPEKKKTYLIPKGRFQYFISKYYPLKKITNRKPAFYSFLIPIPSIEFQKEFSGNTWDISIAKFHQKTFQAIEHSAVRLKIPYTFDLRANLFGTIFQADFQNVFNLCEDYKDYLSASLNIDVSKIDTSNLIVPYYCLSREEIIKLKSKEDEIERAILDEMRFESEKY